jgi:site-specific recombinase XerD
MTRSKAMKKTRSWQSDVDDFITRLNEDEKSEVTQVHYRDALDEFARWHQEQYEELPVLALLKPIELREWKAHLQKKRTKRGLMKPASINAKLSALRSMLRWAKREDRAPEIRTPKTVAQQPLLPRWLTRLEELRLLRAVAREGKARDLAIVTLLVNTGMRVGELVRLEWSGVHVAERSGSVHVVGKGAKERDIALNIEARRALHDLDYERFKGRDEPVLWGQRGKMTIRGVENIVERYKDRAKIPHLTCHCLRHTFAKRLADAGVRLEVIAALLGHSSVNMAARYTQPGATDLAAAVDSIAAGEE